MKKKRENWNHGKKSNEGSFRMFGMGICSECKKRNDEEFKETEPKMIYHKALKLCILHYRMFRAEQGRIKAIARKKKKEEGEFTKTEKILMKRGVFPGEIKKEKPKKEYKVPRHNVRFTKKKTKPSGEAKVFEKIWESDRPKVSIVTDKPLSDVNSARSWYFSHILPKGKYPKFRLNEENIQYMELSEHHDWEFRRWTLEDKPEWQHVFELEQMLKIKYKEEHGK